MLPKPRVLMSVALVLCVLVCAGVLVAHGMSTPPPLQAQVKGASPGVTVPYRAPTVVPATPPPASTAASATPTMQPSPVAHVVAGPKPLGGVPDISGQLILVSLEQQWLWAYDDQRLLFSTPITSGMPQLPTPVGIYQVKYHEENVMFYSPWPQGSPFYYTPEHINYAMYFRDFGFYIHDAPWRDGNFGPYTNFPHRDPDGITRTGSHGCVEVPTDAGALLYAWTRDGATLDIYGYAPTVAPPTPTPTPTFTPTIPPAREPQASTAAPAAQPRRDVAW